MILSWFSILNVSCQCQSPEIWQIPTRFSLSYLQWIYFRPCFPLLIVPFWCQSPTNLQNPIRPAFLLYSCGYVSNLISIFEKISGRVGCSFLTDITCSNRYEQLTYKLTWNTWGCLNRKLITMTKNNQQIFLNFQHKILNIHIKYYCNEIWSNCEQQFLFRMTRWHKHIRK